MKYNSVDNVGAKCVCACGQMIGWVNKGSEFVQVEVDCNKLQFYLHKKIPKGVKVNLIHN